MCELKSKILINATADIVHIFLYDIKCAAQTDK